MATRLIPADRVRAWEIINEAVKAANATEDFTGEDSFIYAQLRTRHMGFVTNAPAVDFDLTGAFKSLARDDLFRSIQMAKSFNGEASRAVATLAIARSVFESK